MAAQGVPELSSNKENVFFITGPKLLDEQFTSWRKRFLLHIGGIEPYLLTILTKGPYVPMAPGAAAGVEIPKPEPQWTLEERRLVNLDVRLKSMIISCLPEDVMNSIIENETAKEAWDDLCVMHEGTDEVLENKKTNLKKDFDAFFSLPSETLQQTHTRFKSLLNQLKSYGIIKDKTDVLHKFMDSLPFKWNSFRQIMRTNGTLKNHTLPSLYGTFLFEEQSASRIAQAEADSRKNVPSTSLSTALYSNTPSLELSNESNVSGEEISKEEWLNELMEEFAQKALLAGSAKKFFRKGPPRFGASSSQNLY